MSLTIKRLPESILFIILLIGSLVPLWLHPYYLTGDGPCHVYNAKIVFDLWLDHDYDFYNPYFYLHRILLPNWFSHFWLGLLLQFFSPALAEKILLSAYVILLPISVRYAIKQVNPQSQYLALLSFPFIYNRVFQMGFYNFSFGVVFCFLIIGYWLRWRKEMTNWRLAVWALLWLLGYFSHPVGLTYALGGLGLFIIVEGLITRAANRQTWREALTHIFDQLIKMGLACLPVLMLFANFFYYRYVPSSPSNDSFDQLQREFFELSAMMSVTHQERPWATSIAIFIGLILIYVVVARIRERRWSLFDGLFLAFALTLLAYFKSPGTLAGAGILSVRLQFFPYLMILLWLAIPTVKNYFRYAVMAYAVLVSFVLIGLRLPAYQRQADAIEEILSAAPYIEDHKTVLPLSYSFNGLTPAGEQVTDAIWLFIHVFDYLGAQKTLVIFPNYETSTWNFPLLYRWQTEGFTQIGNTEREPPIASFLDYPRRTGGKVDYVLTWCIDQVQKDSLPEVKSVRDQLQQGYELVFISKNSLVKLYKRQPGK
jgi:hypothetical protein